MFFSAIILGAAGGFHCAGMCGPIVMAIPVGNFGWIRQLIGYLIYHVGRLVGYAILGFLFGILGYGLNLTGFQQGISIGLGVLMILLVWFPKVLKLTSLSSVIVKLQSGLTRFMAVRLKSNRAGALLGLGFFNGFLPCGLVYVALAASLGLFDPFQGALFMMVFGLGTIPMLLAIGLTGQKLSQPLRTQLKKVAPLIATVFAILFILRGLGLGIPYVSPELGLKANATEICEP